MMYTVSTLQVVYKCQQSGVQTTEPYSTIGLTSKHKTDISELECFNSPAILL